MISSTLKCILFLVICASPVVVAGDWQKLNGAEIEFTLSSRILGYEKEEAIQDFLRMGGHYTTLPHLVGVGGV